MLRLLLPAALLASAVAAQADTIDLVGGWNINWNIVTSPAASPTQEIQIQNLTSPATNEVFNEYDLGLIFQRVEGSGQIALTASNATNPSSDSIVPSWLGAPEFGTGANTFGAGFEALIGNEALQPMNYEVPDSPASLVTVDFAPGRSHLRLVRSLTFTPTTAIPTILIPRAPLLLPTPITQAATSCSVRSRWCPSRVRWPWRELPERDS